MHEIQTTSQPNSIASTDGLLFESSDNATFGIRPYADKKPNFQFLQSENSGDADGSGDMLDRGAKEERVIFLGSIYSSHSAEDTMRTQFAFLIILSMIIIVLTLLLVWPRLEESKRRKARTYPL